MMYASLLPFASQGSLALVPEGMWHNNNNNIMIIIILTQYLFYLITLAWHFATYTVKRLLAELIQLNVGIIIIIYSRYTH